MGVNFNDVVDLIPDEKAIIMRKPGRPYCAKYHLKKGWEKFEFEAVKWIKLKPNPEDRYWDFEMLDEHGVPSRKMLLNLISSRKTRAEKEEEMRLEHQIEKEIRDATT